MIIRLADDTQQAIRWTREKQGHIRLYWLPMMEDTCMEGGVCCHHSMMPSIVISWTSYRTSLIKHPKQRNWIRLSLTMQLLFQPFPKSHYKIINLEMRKPIIRLIAQIIHVLVGTENLIDVSAQVCVGFVPGSTEVKDEETFHSANVNESRCT